MDDSLQVLRAHYRERTHAAMAHKRAGGKVVAYLCDNVPVELITAAGFFPLRISGDPDAGTALVEANVDSLYPPDVVTRPRFVTALIEQLLAGAYAFVDYLVIPHNRNAIQAIYRELHDALRENPSLPAYSTYYLDKAWSSSYTAEVFNRDQIIKFKKTLELWSGEEISDQRLAEALSVQDDNRRLLAALAALRRQTPPRLSGASALEIIGASMVMDVAEHSRLLETVLKAAPAWPPRSGPRLFVGGSPHDHTRVYEAIESCGATIVAEDHCWGERTGDLIPGAAADPLLEIARRFHRRPACSIVFPLDEVVRACALRAVSARVEGAIFYVVDDDWSQNWETPNEARALEALGVPCLTLSRQSYEARPPLAVTRKIAEFIGALERQPGLEGASEAVSQ